MSDFIILDDSNDSCSPEDHFGAERIKNLQRRKAPKDSASSSDLDDPSVPFSYADDVEKSANWTSEEIDENLIPTPRLSSSCEEDFPRFDLPQKRKELDVPGTSYGSNLNKGRRSFHSLSDSDDSDDVFGKAQQVPPKSTEISKNVRKPKGSKGKNPKGTNKDKAKEEKLLKKQNLLKQKALKDIADKKLKNIKPVNCMKFMEVMFDKNLKSFDFYNEAIEMLNANQIKHSTPFYSMPNSITWKRNTEEYCLNGNNEICTDICPEVENHVIVIWSWTMVVNAVADGSFSTVISKIRDLVPNYNITIVIYKIKSYFAAITSKGGKSQKHKGSNECFRDFPIITSDQLEASLTEIQIYYKCNSRLVETEGDLALMIYQYTKSIAEIPYKEKQNNTLESNYDWYVNGDKKGTVSVDKDGNGLKRLWQQQLCQFNLMSLEIAETICSKYPSPLALLEAYINCTPQEGANLLKDMPIRRAGGLLTTSRKIGPELSRKIYTMFTAENPKTPLS